MIFFKQLAREVGGTLRRPRRILQLLKSPAATSRRVLRRLWSALRIDAMGARWQPAGEGQSHRLRQYRSYEAYLRHQGSKLQTLELTSSSQRFQSVLRDRLEPVLPSTPGAALCLGARLGSEVRALHELGWFAVGIDVNPGERNPYVLTGDFHHLVFPTASVDLAYTNALDHALDPSRFLREVHRVLRPGGTFVLEVAERSEPGAYEAFAWSSVDSLLPLLVASGFGERQRSAFDYPWEGAQLLLTALRQPTDGSLHLTSGRTRRSSRNP